MTTFYNALRILAIETPPTLRQHAVLLGSRGFNPIATTSRLLEFRIPFLFEEARDELLKLAESKVCIQVQQREYDQYLCSSMPVRRYFIPSICHGPAAVEEAKLSAGGESKPKKSYRKESLLKLIEGSTCKQAYAFNLHRVR